MVILFSVRENEPLWRNWQTHLTQNQAGNTVWVQVPPPAPTLGGKTFVLPPIFIFMNLYTIIYIINFMR